MTTTLVELAAVTKDFKGHRATDALSLAFKSGSTVGLLGPNGAGKTSCLKMMLGLLRPGRPLALPVDDRSPGHAVRLGHVRSVVRRARGRPPGTV